VKELLSILKRTLRLDIEEADVKRLQEFLNTDPDTLVSASGAGSIGKETEYFGKRTERAVRKFQKKYNIVFGSIELS